ncbi:MAG: hypothetical protein JWR07_4590 [Nevskia sp.]|nr:hypothetical protein [Nevskia sp.]
MSEFTQTIAQKITDPKYTHLATEFQLRESLEKYSTRADRHEWLLVVSLLLEIVVVWYFSEGKSPFETWALIFTTFAVAFSVYGEFRSSHKAGRFQQELGRRSEEKVAAANERVAIAEERAAKLEKEAADARERTAQLEKLTAWRRLTAEDRRKFADIIRSKVGLFDLLIEYERADPEAFMFAHAIGRAFFDAGIKGIRLIPNSLLEANAFGVHTASSLGSEANVVVEAFKATNIPINIFNKDLGTHLPRNVTAPNLYIFVGTRIPEGIGE